MMGSFDGQRDGRSSYRLGLPGSRRPCFPPWIGQALPERKHTMQFVGRIVRNGSIVMAEAHGSMELQDGLYNGHFGVEPPWDFKTGDTCTLIVDLGEQSGGLPIVIEGPEGNAAIGFRIHFYGNPPIIWKSTSSTA